MQRSGTNSQRYAHAEVWYKLTKVYTYKGQEQRYLNAEVRKKGLHLLWSETKVDTCRGWGQSYAHAQVRKKA